VLFPLYYRRQKDGRALTLTPLGGGLRTKDRLTWMATPLLYGARDTSGPAAQRRSSFGLMPLVFQDRRPVDGGVAKNLVVVPLFARHRAPARTSTCGARWSGARAPAARSRARTWRCAVVLPPAPARRDRRRRGMAPAVLPQPRQGQRRTHTLIAGPFFHRLSRTSLNTGVLPLAWWMDSEKARRLISLPLIFHIKNKQSREHTTIAVPFWFDRRKANGRRTWVALPFVIGNKGQHNFTRFSLVPPGFVDVHRLAKNYRFTGYAPLLFRYQKCGFREEDDDRCRYTLWGSFPLFLAGRDGMGRRSHGALMLYYFDRDKGGKVPHAAGRRQRAAQGEADLVRAERRPHGHAHARDDGGVPAVLPQGAPQRGPQHDGGAAAAVHRPAQGGVPLVRGGAGVLELPSPAQGDDRGAAADLLHGARVRREAHDLDDPAVPAQQQLGGGPQRDDRAAGSVRAAAQGRGQNWVQFPLLWHIERGENSGTVGAAVWWDITPQARPITQVVPALLARHVNRKGDATTVVGPGLGWWTRKSEQGQKALHWRALFGIVGGGNEAGKRYFSLFGGRIGLKAKAVWEPRGIQIRAEKKRRAAEAKAAEKAKAEKVPSPAAPGRSLVPAETRPASKPATTPTPVTSPPAAAPPLRRLRPRARPRLRPANPSASPWSGAAPGGRPGVNTSSPPPAPSGTTTPSASPPGR
jgi:hypothetical protein